MRKIKFRGKPTENNVSYFEKEEFAYGFLVIDNDQYYILLDVLDNIKRDDYVTYMVEIKSETIGQYTGLKDKNGKEIYEGDIIKIHKHSYDYGFKKDEIGQIKFTDGCFGFYREKTKNEYYFNDLATESGYGELDYYEVIGNVWEDSDLLNDNKNTESY